MTMIQNELVPEVGETIVGTQTKILEVFTDFDYPNINKPYFLVMDELGFMYVIFTALGQWYTAELAE